MPSTGHRYEARNIMKGIVNECICGQREIVSSASKLMTEPGEGTGHRKDS